MAMKSPHTPRRVYLRNSVACVLFAGSTFGTAETTKVKVSLPARVSGNGDGTVTVSQRTRSHRGPSKLVTETWGKVAATWVPQ